MCIERQPHRYFENNPEHNWSSKEATIKTKDFCRQQQRSFNQTSQFNDHQEYRQIRIAQKKYSFNTYGSEKQDHHSKMLTGIPMTPRKHAPVIPNELLHEHHMKNRPLYPGTSIIEYRKGNKSQIFIKSHVKDKNSFLNIKIFHPRLQLGLIQKTKVMKDQLKNIWIFWYCNKDKYTERKRIKERLKKKERITRFYLFIN